MCSRRDAGPHGPLPAFWFLPVFAALTAVTPLAARLHPLWPFAVVQHAAVFRHRAAAPGCLRHPPVRAGSV